MTPMFMTIRAWLARTPIWIWVSVTSIVGLSIILAGSDEAVASSTRSSEESAPKQWQVVSEWSRLIDIPKVENSQSLPGELLNDLVTCFEVGRESDLLEVRTYEEQELFRSWVRDYREAGGAALTVFLWRWHA